jgi:hypothetical protein
MLKQLMQKPSVKLNMTLQYCRTVANSDVNSLETCLKTYETFTVSNCVMIFFFVFLNGHFSFHLKMQYSTRFSEWALPVLFNSQMNEHMKVDAKVKKCGVKFSTVVDPEESYADVL